LPTGVRRTERPQSTSDVKYSHLIQARGIEVDFERKNMAGLNSINNVWKNVKEIDLRPIRQEALQSIRIAIVGKECARCDLLANAMRTDPARPEQVTQTPIIMVGPDDEDADISADLLILLLSANEMPRDHQRNLVSAWAKADKNILVLVDQLPEAANLNRMDAWLEWGQQKVVRGSVADAQFLQKEYIAAVLELLPGRELSLARKFPLFRQVVARKLINDTSFSNATYAFSTGLAEIIPIIDIPLNVTDMIVLTKAQAFLVYRLGLALGLSTEWRDYVAEFGGVLGGGFLWRQVARSLIGLIPAWGIIPKVAVAYAGTYAVGYAVLQWYLTGRHVTRKQLNDLYRQAFVYGKNVAAGLLKNMPRPRLKNSQRKSLPEPKKSKRALICPNCGKRNAADARYCQYCGVELTA
jgi:uncharacterized protein (DUF697 family)